jgi:hypothetical protein
MFWLIWRNSYLMVDVFKHNHCKNSMILARLGYLWAFQNYYELEYTTMTIGCAAWEGHLEIVKWLYNHKKEFILDAPLNFIIWIRETGMETWGSIIAEIMQNSIKWRHENRTNEYIEWAIGLYLAEVNGHLKIVQWLRENCKELLI